MGGNGVAPIFTVIVCIGALVAYWFWDASQFLQGNHLNFSQSTFLPVSCSINADAAADVRQAITVYFWQDESRTDVRILGDKPDTGHQIVASGKVGYLWKDSSAYGEVSPNVTTHPLVDNLKSANQWFCFPWILFDPNEFSPPKNITFQ
jgi:hypothetical protein